VTALLEYRYIKFYNNMTFIMIDSFIVIIIIIKKEVSF